MFGTEKKIVIESARMKISHLLISLVSDCLRSSSFVCVYGSPIIVSRDLKLDDTVEHDVAANSFN